MSVKQEKKKVGENLKRPRVKDSNSFKIRNFLKVNVIVYSLIFSTSPVTYASDMFNDITNAVLMGGDSLQQMYSQNMGQTQPMTQAQIQAQERLVEMGQDYNKNNQLHQTLGNRHFVFRNCPVPPDKPVRPDASFCSSGGATPQDMVTAMTYANNYINMYNAYIQPKNSKLSIGKSCVENSVKLMKDQAQSLLDRYQRSLEQYNKMIKTALDNQKVNMKEMRDLSALLYNPNASSDIKVKTMSFPSIVGKNCNDILPSGGSLNNIGRQGGLTAILTTFNDLDLDASNFRSSAYGLTKKQIQRDIDIISNKFKNDGIGVLTDSYLTTDAKFKGAISQALTEKIAPLQSSIEKANAVLAELGVKDQLPDLNSNLFEAKFRTVTNKVANNFEDKFIYDCITGKNGAASSTAIREMISSFRHSRFGEQGDKAKNFRKYTNQDLSGAINLTQLEVLVNTNNDNNITAMVTNENNEGVEKTLRQYFNDIKKECTMIYNGELPPANGATSLTNYKAQAEAAKEQIKKVKDQISGEKALNVTKILSDHILNCGGDILEPADCASGAFNKSSPSFCLKKAKMCSEEVKSCGEKAAQLVTSKNNELASRANNYNQVVTNLETTANNMLTKMSSELASMAQNLHNNIFPKNMTEQEKQMMASLGMKMPDGFSTPALVPIQLGISENPKYPGMLLKGDGDLTSLANQAKEAIDMLSQNFKTYTDTNIDSAQDAATNLMAGWESEVNEFKKFIERCGKTLADIKQSSEEQYAEKMNSKNEAISNARSFCSKIGNISMQNQPTPGCDKRIRDILDASGEAAEQYLPDAHMVAMELESVCQGSQNNSSDKEEPEDIDYLKMSCRDNGNKFARVKSKMKKDIIDKIPSDLRKHKNAIKEYLEGNKSSDNLHDDVQTSPFIRTLEAYRALGKEDNIKHVSLRDVIEQANSMNIGDTKTLDGRKNSLKYLLEIQGFKDISEIMKNIDADVASDSDDSKIDIAKLENATGDKEILKKRLDIRQETDPCKARDDSSTYFTALHTKKCLDIDKNSKGSLTSCLEEKSSSESHYKKAKALQEERLSNYQEVLRGLALVEKQSIWAETGEKFAYTSCSHLNGTTISKGILEDIGTDNPYLDPFNLGVRR